MLSFASPVDDKNKLHKNTWNNKGPRTDLWESRNKIFEHEL